MFVFTCFFDPVCMFLIVLWELLEVVNNSFYFISWQFQRLFLFSFAFIRKWRCSVTILISCWSLRRSLRYQIARSISSSNQAFIITIIFNLWQRNVSIMMASSNLTLVSHTVRETNYFQFLGFSILIFWRSFTHERLFFDSWKILWLSR